MSLVIFSKTADYFRYLYVNMFYAATVASASDKEDKDEEEEDEEDSRVGGDK